MPLSKTLLINNEKCVLHYSKYWSSPKGFDEFARAQRIKNRKKLGRFKSAEKSMSFSSVSHTADLGVWVESQKPVGVDVESKTRAISTAAKLRLGVESEFSKLPSPIYLWVIKEACWKAFREHPKLKQPKAISYIYVTGVKKDARGFRFSFTTLKREFTRTKTEKTQGFGYVTALKGHILATAVLK